VTDADVDVWHCDNAGVYSSETSDNPGFCTGNNAAALKARYFRGHHKTDDSGVAWFSTCFPGWYSSRAIHVHFTVRRSSRSGDEYLTAQVAFPEDLIKEICATHPDYTAHGQPDTANTSDTVFSAATVNNYLVNTQKMSDGALLAWKTVIIRSSLSTSVCSGGNSSGPGGMGAPPRG
jgi:protocatechuate 3,4-dioxygenase beta subunit